ncbi:MAG: 50S ribosomal protein L32e [Candidatus Bathyarchaeia archaeon]
MSGKKGGPRQRAPSKPKKRKKPKFQRQENWRYKRIKENWRRPRGIDSKMRKKVKGWPPSPNKGYRSPREIRNLHPSGLREVRAMNVRDLDKVDPESDAVRIGHRVGDRKRIEIINRAREMGIHILNPKEIEVEA